MVRAALIVFVYTAALAATAQIVSAGTDEPPQVSPPIEMDLGKLQDILLGRLLWALGKVSDADNACRVSGPIYSLKWRYYYNDNACQKWDIQILMAMTEDEQLLSAQGFSEKYAILESRVSQDANASYQLCKRDDAFCTDVVRLYQLAAQRDQNVEAEFRVGLAYTRIPPSADLHTQDEAITWLRRAAERDHVEAQWELANQYEWRSLGWNFDRERLGEKWELYRKTFHYPPNGAKDDFDEAMKWWQRAAENGHTLSQYQLGYRYETGEGIPQDYVQAYKWRELAIQGASPTPPLDETVIKHWVDHRNELAAKMTPQQLSEGQGLVGNGSNNTRVQHRSRKHTNLPLGPAPAREPRLQKTGETATLRLHFPLALHGCEGKVATYQTTWASWLSPFSSAQVAYYTDRARSSAAVPSNRRRPCVPCCACMKEDSTSLAAEHRHGF